MYEMPFLPSDCGGDVWGHHRASPATVTFTSLQKVSDLPFQHPPAYYQVQDLYSPV